MSYTNATRLCTLLNETACTDMLYIYKKEVIQALTRSTMQANAATTIYPGIKACRAMPMLILKYRLEPKCSDIVTGPACISVPWLWSADFRTTIVLLLQLTN